MILEQVLFRIEAALKNLKPQVVDFADYEQSSDSKPLVVVRVVSESFENIRTFTRYKILDDTLSVKDPELYRTFIFAYECFTPLEYKMIRLQANMRH